MQTLLTLMDKVKSSGAFAAGGTLPSIPPGLTVAGIGHIGLPLTAEQAQALIAHSEQAPFGRREATLVDTDVRKNWQIGAADFALTNPQWHEAMQTAVDQIGQELGLADCKISFETYKLLIYEEGSFFTAHRDTEKIPNMFATMVVNLPSEHEGGELIISHAGQSKRYSFADSSLFASSFVAFYADCYHEVKPVTAGYRLSLIYNLAITNRKQQPDLAEQLGVIEEVEQAIQAWKEAPDASPILTYLLDHSYSEQNLSMSNLKLSDFAKASVLLSAAANRGCQAYLCLVTYHQASYGEVMSYGYGRRGRYSYYDDDEDGDEDNEDAGEDVGEDDFEEYDVDEEKVYAHAFITADGDKVAVQELVLNEDDLVAKIPLRDGPGREVAISEATGNEGATKDLWYHRGAVILWPNERELDLVASMDVDYGIHVLKRTLKEQKNLDDEVRQSLIWLAHHILDSQSYFHNVDISQELIKLEDLDLLRKFIFRQANSYSLRVEPEVFIQVAEKFGWRHFAEDVQSRLTAQDGMKWLDSLLQTGESISDEGRGIIEQWVESRWEQSVAVAIQSLSAPAEPANARERRGHHYDLQRFNQQKQGQQAELVYLVRLTACLNMEEIAQKAIARLADHADKQFLTETYGPAMVEVRRDLQQKVHNQAIVQHFTDAVRQRIQTEFPKPPEPPQDWSRAGQLACDCEFCAQVNAFLPKSNVPSMGIYGTLKRNLLHVEEELAKQQIEAEMEIRKRAPKFDGTIQKNQRQYEQQLKLYNAAQEIGKQLSS
ncbi:MAG: 2OG-Fe(II) oxygenase [Caldilineaceae bacterium]